MSMIGGFPGLQDARRRTIRGPINPADKATIVSIFPKYIKEFKYTISPGVFELFPGSVEKPSLLVVGSSSWWREIDEEQPLLEITNGAIQVADSVVNDYCNGILGCDMSEAKPGLFYVPGEHTLNTLRKSFQHEVDAAEKRQRRWYEELINIADTMWARSGGSPLAISDDMRLAAKEIGVDNKDWMQSFTMMRQERCFACGTPKSPDYPVCPSCRAIDMNHPNAANIKFAAS